MGFRLGPEGGCEQWGGPIQKLENTVNIAHAEQLPSQLAALEFSFEAISVLQYVVR